MYTGTLIDELIAAVERAETTLCAKPKQESEFDFWCEIVPADLAAIEPAIQLAGVA
jgi:hypothetical protein